MSEEDKGLYLPVSLVDRGTIPERVIVLLREGGASVEGSLRDVGFFALPLNSYSLNTESSSE